MRPSSEKGVSELLANLSLDKLAVALLALTVLRLLLLLCVNRPFPDSLLNFTPLPAALPKSPKPFWLLAHSSSF